MATDFCRICRRRWRIVKTVHNDNNATELSVVLHDWFEILFYFRISDDQSSVMSYNEGTFVKLYHIQYDSRVRRDQHT